MAKKLTNQENTDMSIKINLSVLDRIHFPALMPLRGSMAENALAEALSKRVIFTPAEIMEYKIALLPDGRTIWNQGKAKLREFRFEKFEMILIQAGVRMHDEGRSIPRDANSLAEKLLSINVNDKA